MKMDMWSSSTVAFGECYNQRVLYILWMSCTLQLNTENTFISVTVRALEAFRFKWVTAKKEKRLPLKSECFSEEIF